MVLIEEHESADVHCPRTSGFAARARSSANLGEDREGKPPLLQGQVLWDRLWGTTEGRILGISSERHALMSLVVFVPGFVRTLLPAQVFYSTQYIRLECTAVVPGFTVAPVTCLGGSQPYAAQPQVRLVEGLSGAPYLELGLFAWGSIELY